MEFHNHHYKRAVELFHWHPPRFSQTSTAFCLCVCFFWSFYMNGTTQMKCLCVASFPRHMQLIQTRHTSRFPLTPERVLLCGHLTSGCQQVGSSVREHDYCCYAHLCVSPVGGRCFHFYWSDSYFKCKWTKCSNKKR